MNANIRERCGGLVTPQPENLSLTEQVALLEKMYEAMCAEREASNG